MDERWLAQFEQKINDMRQKSGELQRRLAEDAATVQSQDGSVTVTVGLTGALQDIRLGHRACELGPARLTTLIMQTMTRAQGVAAHKAADAFRPLGGGTEAMKMLNIHLPELTRQDEAAVHDTPPAPNPPPMPSPPPVAAQPRRQPVRRATDEEESNEDLELW